MNTEKEKKIHFVAGDAVQMKAKEAFESIPEGKEVFVACSGGGDSVALSYLTKYFAEKKFKGILYFDHKQREASVLKEESSFVKSLSDFLGVEFIKGEMKNDSKGMSEEKLRRERYGFFENFARQKEIMILLGHNLDDRIETFMFNLMRGTGLKGLLSIRERRGVYFRPLLGVTRDQIRKFLMENSIRYLQDASNSWLHYKRNKIRDVLMPVFGEISGRDYGLFFLRLFDSLQLDSETLQESDEKILNEVAWPSREGYTIDLKAFDLIPEHSKRRILRIASLKSGYLSLDGCQTERLLSLTDRSSGNMLNCGGLKARRRNNMLHIQKKQGI